MSIYFIKNYKKVNSFVEYILSPNWNVFSMFQSICIISINFSEPNIDIDSLDIPVNAVATALKDFFSKHLPPLFDKDVMTELEDIACKLALTSNPAHWELVILRCEGTHSAKHTCSRGTQRRNRQLCAITHRKLTNPQRTLINIINFNHNNTIQHFLC